MIGTLWDLTVFKFCRCFLQTFLCVVIVKGTCGLTSLLICPPGLKEDRQVSLYSFIDIMIVSIMQSWVSDKWFVWLVCRHTQTKWVYCGLQRASSSQHLMTEPSNCGTDELRNRYFYSCFYARCVYQCLFNFLSVSHSLTVFYWSYEVF